MPEQTIQQTTPETPIESLIFNSDVDKNLFKKYPKLMIKLNHILKDLGFKSVICGEEFNEFTAKEEMTLSISPNVSSLPYTYLSFSDRLSGFKGWNGVNEFVNIETEREKIEVSIKGIYNRERKFEIASYFPERNTMVLNFNIYVGCSHQNSEKEEDNQLMFLMINGIKKWVEENKEKFKERDTKEFIKELLEKKFNKIIVESIRIKKLRNTELEENINNDYDNISEFSREVISNKKELIGLAKVREEMKGNFLEKLKTIETLPFVNGFEITEKGVSVDVGKISIEKTYIGEFIIHILPNKITATNKKPLITEFSGGELHHPHIRGHAFCLGEGRKKKLLELLAQNKFKEAVFMAYLSLKNYNKEDSYNDIEFWKNENYNPNEDEEEG